MAKWVASRGRSVRGRRWGFVVAYNMEPRLARNAREEPAEDYSCQVNSTLIWISTHKIIQAFLQPNAAQVSNPIKIHTIHQHNRIKSFDLRQGNEC